MVTDDLHIIKATSENVQTEPYQDENGDWVLPVPGQKCQIEQQGRAEVNNGPTKVTGVDGIKVDFAYMIYLPIDSYEFYYQQEVEIFNLEGKKIGGGTVKNFHKGLIGCKLWV